MARLPANAPTLKAAIELIYGSIFCDGESHTPYWYANEMCSIIESIEVNERLEVDSDLFRLLYEAGVYVSRGNSKDFPAILQDESFRNFGAGLVTPCNQQSVKNWLTGKNETLRTENAFVLSVFFTYLLFKRNSDTTVHERFIKGCLELLGMENLPAPVLSAISRISWGEIGEDGFISGKKQVTIAFSRLKNRSLITIVAIVYTLLERAGRTIGDGEAYLRLANHIETTYSAEFLVLDAISDAEKNLYQCVNVFEPRSIVRADLHLEDVFVQPRFLLRNQSQQNVELVEPLTRIANARRSKRMIIVGSTGLGKSVYLQMATVCMLHNRYAESTNRAIAEIGRAINSPDDCLVISIPARMFSFCQINPLYERWTTDFVDLFFNSMWSIAKDYNFFSSQGLHRSDNNFFSTINTSLSTTQALRDYLHVLARQGKLIFLLDSYDEIPMGPIRTQYVATLSKLYTDFCSYPDGIGAHVILTSRQLSKATMQQVYERLALPDVIDILPLAESQCRDLVYRWNRNVRATAPEQVDMLLRQISSNHYLQEFAKNPYMLSVLCNFAGHDLGDITRRLIATLLEKMRQNNLIASNYTRDDNDIDYWVLQELLDTKVEPILQQLAIDTVLSGNSKFSRRALNHLLTEQMDKSDMDTSDVERYVNRLHEIFAHEVGLIVPADGADNDYQFVNDQIRYELAATMFINELSSEKIKILSRQEARIKSVQEYVGLFIPMVCRITDDAALAEQLIAELVFHDFTSSDEDRLLIQAYVDLVLSRYGTSIVNIPDPNEHDRQYVRRAQRMILLRLFASPSFKPDADEMSEILNSSVLIGNEEWISMRLLKID